MRSRRDEHLLLQCALIHAFWCLSQAHIYFHLCLFLHLNGLDCKQRERKRNTMDYSGAIFHIAGNFVINSQQPVTGKSTVGGCPYAAFGSTPSQNGWRAQTAHERPKDLPKLCRWQQKCYRSPCPYIHLPQDILESARRPYRLCWAHPRCKNTKCPFIHYSVNEASPPPAPNDANSIEKVVAVPSHLPQSFIRISGDKESTEDDDLRQRIERMRT